MVPKEKYPIQAAQLAVTQALGSLIGPLIGGAISQNTTWRWVFLIKSVMLFYTRATTDRHLVSHVG